MVDEKRVRRALAAIFMAAVIAMLSTGFLSLVDGNTPENATSYYARIWASMTFFFILLELFGVISLRGIRLFDK